MKIRTHSQAGERYLLIGDPPFEWSYLCPEDSDGKPMGVRETLEYWRDYYTERVERATQHRDHVIKALTSLDPPPPKSLLDYTTVPAGTYKCCVAEVRTGQTRAGDERWSLRLTVAEGPHVGKQAAWDSIVFNVRGKARANMIFQVFGLPPLREIQPMPEDLEGRVALVEVRPAEYTTPDGHTVVRNEVPYDGYQPVV